MSLMTDPYVTYCVAWDAEKEKKLTHIIQKSLNWAAFKIHSNVGLIEKSFNDYSRTTSANRIATHLLNIQQTFFIVSYKHR